MFLSSMVLMMMLAAMPPGVAPVPDAELSLCGLERRDPRLAEMTFSAIYRMEFDADGVPMRITKLKDPALGEEAARECLSSWRVRNGGKEVSAYASLSWRRGVLHDVYLEWPDARMRVVIDLP